MRIFAGSQGQFGDIVINTVLFRLIKLVMPSSILMANINKKYADIIPILHNNNYIDGFHIWNEYGNWPSKQDKDFLSILNSDDKVLHPMPSVTRNDWFCFHHQTVEHVLRYKLTQTNLLDGDYRCNLNKWFDINNNKDCIALAVFGGCFDDKNDKPLTITKAQEIVDGIRKLGYNIIQIGGQDEPGLDGVIRRNHLSFFDKIKLLLSCRTLVHNDTCYGWIASGYEFPCVGLYSNGRYGVDNVKNIQPINKNAIYFDASDVNNINVENIVQAINILK